MTTTPPQPPSATITLHPCPPSSAPALGALNAHAFWTDSVWRALWERAGRTLPHVAAAAARRMPHHLLADAERRRHLRAVDVRTGRAVGYARWVLPGVVGCGGMWPAARVGEVGGEERAVAEREFGEADWAFDRALDVLDPPVLEVRERVTRGREFVVLDYLTVHPDFRGQGIASMLVEAGLRETEKLGLDSFVMAMRAALGVYQRAGFVLVDQVIQDASRFGAEKEYGTFFLIKEPPRDGSQLANAPAGA